MKKKEAEELVTKHYEAMVDKLCIRHWTLSLNYGDCGGACFRGECRLQPEYRQAAITINLKLIETPKEFLEVLFHELLHVACGDFDMLLDIVKPTLKGESKELFQNVFANAIERVVWQLEQVFKHGLDLQVEDMLP